MQKDRNTTNIHPFYMPLLQSSNSTSVLVQHYSVVGVATSWFT